MQLASRGTSGAEDSTAFAKLAELHHQLSVKEQELNDATAVCSQREEQLQFVALHVDQETDDEDVLQLTADLQTLVNDAVTQRGQLHAEQQTLSQVNYHFIVAAVVVALHGNCNNNVCSYACMAVSDKQLNLT